VKVVLNPKHFRVRTKPTDGTVWLTHEKYLQAVIPIKDITDEILLCLCADLSGVDGTERVERSVRFNDGWQCKITVEVVKDEK